MFDNLKNKVKSVFGKKEREEVKNVNSAVEEIPLNELGEIKEDEIPVATPIEEATASEKVKEAVGEAIDNAKAGADKVVNSKAMNDAGNAVEIAASTVGEAAENVGQKVVEGGKKIADSKAMNTAGGAVEKAVYAVGDAAEKVGGKIADAGKKVIHSEAVTKLWGDIKKTGASVGNFAQKQFDEIKKNFNEKGEEENTETAEEVRLAEEVKTAGPLNGEETK